MPSHYLNQCWNIVNWTLGNTFQWNFYRNQYIFIQEMHLKISSAKWRLFHLVLIVLKPINITYMYRDLHVTVMFFHHLLIHWGRDKMAAFSQTTLSNGFSWMKILEFRLKIHWSLFLRVLLTIFQHWLRWWLGADQATNHYLNQCWLDHWLIYASLGLNELIVQS